MIKDTKYIIKRILIGVGIILVLSFIRGNKVKALEVCNFSKTNCVDINDNQIPQYCVGKKLYFYSSLPTYTLRGSCSSSTQDSIYNLNNSPLTVQNFISSDNTDVWELNLNTKLMTYKGTTSQGYGFFNPSYPINSPDSYYMYSDFNLYGTNDKSQPIYIVPPTTSSIESLQALKINQESYIVSYVFKPKFSNFNIDSYIYQYRVGNNGTWLNISQNEEQITINNNNTIYFRILDKSNNEVVDSQTYTITDIGTLNNELNYSIDFSTDYETLENSNIISKYFVDINYLPKSSILKYQYQFVLDGSFLDNNNWNSLDPEVFSYNFETFQNGTLYARILDNEDNVLTTNTFTITEIGKFAINNNNKKNNGFFNKISSSINFGGPISGIINIPINLIKTLSTSIASNTCNNYNLGSLWGTTLFLPCVNIKQYLGDSLYFTIDLIIACVMIYHIIKMFGELYTNLLFMQKNPIQDLGRRGD